MSDNYTRLTAISEKAMRKHPELRKGQALMNALHAIDIHTYQEIAGSISDPYYVDARIDAFYETLKVFW